MLKSSKLVEFIRTVSGFVLQRISEKIPPRISGAGVPDGRYLSWMNRGVENISSLIFMFHYVAVFYCVQNVRSDKERCWPIMTMRGQYLQWTVKLKIWQIESWQRKVMAHHDIIITMNRDQIMKKYFNFVNWNNQILSDPDGSRW